MDPESHRDVQELKITFERLRVKKMLLYGNIQLHIGKPLCTLTPDQIEISDFC